VSTARPISSELLQYVSSHAATDDSFLTELKQAARQQGLPEIWIDAAGAAFLPVALAAIGAREVVEVGTLAGYSAIVMARGLPPEGRVRTIELSAEHADFAEEWIARSDVADRVELHRGRGLEVLRGFADRSADVVFLDADKPSYEAYLDEALRLLRPGGLMLADNAFGFGEILDERSADESVRALQSFNDRVARDDRLEGLILPLGDGLWFARVLP